MANQTQIQWAHSTTNPVMGCDGCELYPSVAQIRRLILLIVCSHGADAAALSTLLDALLAPSAQGVKLRLGEIALRLAEAVAVGDKGWRERVAKEIEAEVSKLYVCYAASLHRFFNASGKRAGYAPSFDEPTVFSGRVATASCLPSPSGKEIADKPWLLGYRRLIFISDMGDALSRNISFDFLLAQVIRPVASDAGRRHIWFWLTKRPARMAEFSAWLAERAVAWPDNLVAMTTVTSQQTVGRIAALQKVRAKFRGLSLEPLWGHVDLPLDGIDWVIVGGQSGANAQPFDLTWASSIRDDCRRAGVPFFLKQLGRTPVIGHTPISLKDKHGGNWSEWPEDLRIREVPLAWRLVSRDWTGGP